MSLGQRSYLESKGRGDHSMNEKRMTLEGVYDVDPQGPRVMVKAGLLEPCATSPIAWILLAEEGGTEDKTSGSPNSPDGESLKGP